LLDIRNANINTKNNADGIAALTSAIIESHEAVVKFLISRSVHLNDTDNKGGTPLHRAVVKDHLDIVVDLIEAGAALIESCGTATWL
jgi:ankyrin repeat protein